MRCFFPLVLVPALTLPFVAGCGGASSTSQETVVPECGVFDHGSVADGGGFEGGASDAAEADGAPLSCGVTLSTPTGRPQPVACPSTNYPLPSNAPDGGPACSSLADCNPDGSAPVYAGCLGGRCSVDACTTDGDCGAGMICACASQQGFGNILHANRCIATQCRVDSDCGQGGVCSPSNNSYCGGLQGYFCHTAADTCETNTDCCGSTAACDYEPTLGHWACQAVVVCAG